MSQVIDTPEGIDAYFLLARYYALKIQATTGMVHSQGSVIKRVKKDFPQIKGRTAQKVLEEYGAILREAGILSGVGRNSDRR